MPVEQVRHYIQRAKDFFRGMQLTREDELYRNSSALLAIHSSISFTDALRAGLGDEDLSADDHNQAADALRGLLGARKITAQDGIQRLRYLISMKSAIAYGDERLGERERVSLFLQAERFAAWANGIGRQLNVKGWNHDNE